MRHVLFQAPVCLSVLSVVGFCFQGGGAWMASHYPPLPIASCYIWGTCLGSGLAGVPGGCGAFNKGSKCRELVAGGGLGWVFTEV